MEVFLVSEDISRKIVLEKLFNAFNYGNLGMFIGAGFSKTVIDDKFSPALGWFDLIKEASDNFKIDLPSDKELIGVSLPELATLIIKKLAIEQSTDYVEAKHLFKREICKLSNWLPNKEKTKKFREIFDILNPSWIVTTNYDLVLETILTGKSKSLSPMNYLSAPKNIIPIYHLHGTRLDPETIIITQEDYIPLFRPNEYRQSKLAMTIRESTTLILGYGLGDVNVLSAVDWSKNIYTEENEYPHEIIQALWTSSPKENAYKDENGNIIIEISDLTQFLNELIIFIVKKQKEYDDELLNLNKLIKNLEEENEKFIKDFIEKRDFRLNLIHILSRFEHHMISTYIQFLTVCISRVWEKSNEDGAFEMYNKYLNIILDIVVNYEYKKMSPSLFQLTAESLNKVLRYVNLDSSTVQYYGQSWSATKSWHRRKNDIPQDMIDELYQYSKQNIFTNLKHGLRKLATEDDR